MGTTIADARASRYNAIVTGAEALQRINKDAVETQAMAVAMAAYGLARIHHGTASSSM